MKVLIVEDEPMIGLGLEDEISAAGHEILGPVASTGAALRLAQEHRPSIALIDLDLRHTQDPTALAHALKARFDIPSFVLTSDTSKMSGCIESSLGVISKPLDLDHIADALNVAEEIMRGGNPPPPRVPDGLKLFH
jgi:two-component system, response regulator PdtaR